MMGPSVATTRLQLPVHTFEPVKIPISGASGAGGGYIIESQRITSATDLTPTQQNEYLIGLYVAGGGAGGAGGFQITYDGVHNAVFPCAASGFDATGAIGPEEGQFYPVNYGPIGTKIPSGVQTFTGGTASVVAYFSNRPNPQGPPISAFRGVIVTGTESGTSGTAKTYSIPGPLAKPTGLTALTSIATGTATGVPISQIIMPAIGNYAAQTVPAQLQRTDRPPRIYPVSDFDPASSFSLTHKCLGLGAATTVQICGILWY